jgi:hypothetical protein
MAIPFDAAYYRRQAEKYRKLAKDHTDAGSHEIARKLTEYVADLEATKLKSGRAADSAADQC